VCEVSDGTVSCNCMGWTRRNPPGGRTCKHTQDYEQYLRPLWNNLQTGHSTAGMPVAEPAVVVQAAGREKGGTLTELFSKLEKGGLNG